MDAFERQTLSELVAEQIKRWIIDHRLKTGDRLPTEQDFAKQFGVSRVSVREATKALSFLGILRSAPRRGLSVGHVDMRRASEYLGFHFALSEYPRLQLLRARLVIEIGALPYAAARMTEDPAHFQRLDEMTDRLEKARTVQARIDGDMAFHRALLELSGIEPLQAFDHLLQVFFNQFRESLKSSEWKLGIDGHRRIIEHLRDGNSVAAGQALKEHLEHQPGVSG
ncbi:MAG: FCD domain-containing protein [Planctomycetota bacterium]